MTTWIARLSLLLGGALAGAVVTFAVAPTLQVGPMQTASGNRMQRALVAAHALDPGHHLTSDDLGWAAWPEDSVPDGAFTSFEALFGRADDAEPRIVRHRIEKGEPLRRDNVAPQLLEGMRAASIPVGDAGPGGLVNPGDRVDVILSKTEDGELLSGVIVQDVPVIAVDRRLGTERNRAGRPRATIGVTPTQMKQLLLADRVGDLALMAQGVHETVFEEIDLGDTRAVDSKSDEAARDGVLCDSHERFREAQRTGAPPPCGRPLRHVIPPRPDAADMLQLKRRQLEKQRRLAVEQARLAEEQLKLLEWQRLNPPD